MATIDLKYPAILNSFGRHIVKGGTESRAFLAWFLENYYRLEETEIYDSVCDGPNDKGIDGIYVNDQLRQIDVFQTTISKTDECTYGDAKLKQFTGSISQLSNAQSAGSVFAVSNPELQAIAKRLEIAARIAENYEIRGVFVTNAIPDKSATTYIATQKNLIIYDGVRLLAEFVIPDKTDPISDEFSFDISGQPALPLPIGSNLKMTVAPILATELVSMSGIANGELFAWNVRQYLGKKRRSINPYPKAFKIRTNTNFSLHSTTESPFFAGNWKRHRTKSRFQVTPLSTDAKASPACLNSASTLPLIFAFSQKSSRLSRIQIWRKKLPITPTIRTESPLATCNPIVLSKLDYRPKSTGIILNTNTGLRGESIPNGQKKT
jgi:hypothetical protein